MSDRKKISKHMMQSFTNEKIANDKRKQFLKILRKEVNIGGGGTQRYIIKQGINKGKIVG